MKILQSLVAVSLIIVSSNCVALDVMVGDSAILTEQQFDRATFGKVTLGSARNRCEQRLQAHVERIQESTQMSANQKRRLGLAGELDIHRFFGAYGKAKRSLAYGPKGQREFNEATAKLNELVKPLKMKYDQGLHGAESLLEKTLVKVLSGDQLESLHRMRVENRNAEYLAYIQISIAAVDRRLPMTAKQREGIIELLIEKTQSPAEYGENYRPIYAVLARMAEIEEDLRVLFSKEEWAALKPLFQLGLAKNE